MQPSRIVLLVSLLLVILVVVIAVSRDSGSPSTNLGAAAPAVATGLGENVDGEPPVGGVDAVQEDADLIISRLLLFIAGGIAAAILILTFVVPWFGDLLGSFFYSSEEEVEPDPSALAIARIAQGDYEGAIAEYKKIIEANPTDRFPVVEVAKLYIEKIGDPDRAVAFLEESLNDKEWPVDDAAFLMFRTVDIELEERSNPARARELLELIAENFQGTRHAANAQHRLEKIDSGT